MQRVSILWADDEIELLKPHILLLEQKNYRITPVNSGYDAIELVGKEHFDIVFLDENMPGITGLEALEKIKKINSRIPVVMITKSEEENVMDEAIGGQIADYLIKPVNPNQILLSIKKIIDSGRLVSENVTSKYRQGFVDLSMRVNERMSHDEWLALYKDLVFWELELEKAQENSMQEILIEQKAEANRNFGKHVASNYVGWIKDPDNAPILSHNAFARKVSPLLRRKEKPVLLLVIDNLRFDQWEVLKSRLAEFYTTKEDGLYTGILPTATQYARNAFFAGLTPYEISKRFPDKWLNDDDEGGKNQHEEFFLNDLLKRLRLDLKASYHKIIKQEQGKNLADSIVNQLKTNDLTVVVYNFIDMLSHARTDMEVIKELAEDEAAYRSLTLSWFDHSPLFDLLKNAATQDFQLVVTTDHGSIRVKKPVKIVGDRNTTTNLRYKQGRNLNYNHKEVIEFRKPEEEAGLPKSNLSSVYVMSYPEDYFVYPNNQNYYVNFYKNTFQHGGASLEEMLIPFAILNPK
ncbi:MAG: PglZ domain-containing protein [Bacteroidetes bacterium]|nr:PglZ domain-containing protein [Bacteroidota bacterium]